ncbi:MAG TPA: hypothetical protein VGK40_00505 [Verrucomicrobiae bacterium]|jgi:uridine phosphorylase
MNLPRPALLCFAVREEANPFLRLAGARPDLTVLVTGMGRINAGKNARAALSSAQPKLVLSCGFAGGLNPELNTGTIVFSADEEGDLSRALLAAGAHPVRFHCVPAVVATAAEKQALRLRTGADAVEMESEVIRAVCRERAIPCAIVRVISDAADEDLPLDFQRLMTPEQEIDYGKLAWALAASPGKIGGLLKLQRQTKAAAERLAVALLRVIGG